MAQPTVLFICPVASRFLTVLEALSPEAKVIAGHSPEAFSKEARDEANVVLFTGSSGAILQRIYPDLRRVEWIHCLSAGLDAVLTPEMVLSPWCSREYGESGTASMVPLPPSIRFPASFPSCPI